ncbi:MAG: HRDC domain-containing protein [Deltaproteobacteria bacterium]|nr:HRDC domain-containing protein [Deltaproteobacteria bacterium]
MHFRVLTLPYCPRRGVIDDAPLTSVGRNHEVVDLREYLVTVDGLPQLVCVVQCRALGAPAATRGAAAHTNTATADLPTATVTRPAAADVEPAATDPAHDLDPEQRRLYDAIRTWRAERAHEDGVPRYVVLTNRNLTAVVRRRPQTLAALQGIPGIGRAKVERYGERLLALLHPEMASAAPSDSALEDGKACDGDAPAPTAHDQAGLAAHAPTAIEPEQAPQS